MSVHLIPLTDKELNDVQAASLHDMQHCIDAVQRNEIPEEVAQVTIHRLGTIIEKISRYTCRKSAVVR